MAQDIVINGATYPDTPGLSVPKSGGGSAYFPDTSGDTVTANVLQQGYTAHDASGQPITGTMTPGGGGAVPSDDVIFYDYDGTRLYSYSAAEFAALSSMPANPSHSGLTAQGWNWTLADAKTYVASYGKLNIGQMYVTDDGKTRLYITIAAKGRMTVPLYFSQTVANGVTIDWGDESVTETLSETGNVSTSHTYSSIGDYVITLSPSSGCTLGLGKGMSSYCVLGATGITGRVYTNMLQKVEVGSNVTSISAYAFQYCYSLASITIPSTVTSIATYTFYYCYSLASITIPSSVTSIDTDAFYYCYSLASITIPSSVTTIGNYAFSYCNALASITIPSSVTSIGTYVFSDCCSLASITIPSTVTSIGQNAFYNCNSLASITIPSTVTSIGTYAFCNCYSLASITIPSTVTSIGTYAFSSCCGVSEYHIKRTSPPTLSNKNAFGNIPSDCKIYVPSNSLSIYKSASNWSNYASYMVGE